MSSEEQRDSLQLVNQFVGWGDPRGDLWFVGLEEGATFPEEYLSELRARRARSILTDDHEGDVFWQTPAMIREAGHKPSKTDWGEGALCASLCRADVSVDDYVRTRQWRDHAAFHCNLYALGYQRSGRGFPEQYDRTFGVTGPDDESMKTATNSRHESIRRLAMRFKPKAIVCLGLGHQAQFESALLIHEGEHRKTGQTRAVVYKAQVVLVHHTSRGQFRSAIPYLVSLLQQKWQVYL